MAASNILSAHSCIHRQESEHGIGQRVSPHTLLLVREKHTTLFPLTPPADDHLVIQSAGVRVWLLFYPP